MGSPRSSTLWEAEWEDVGPRKMLKQTNLVRIRCDALEDRPLEILDHNRSHVRDLTGEESDLLREQGHVSNIVHHHPRVSHYGSPIGAAPFNEVWRGICGTLGFQPHPEMGFETKDTGDDTTGYFYLTMRVSDKVKEALRL